MRLRCALLLFTFGSTAAFADIAQWDFEGSLEATTDHEPLVEQPFDFNDFFFDEAEINGETADVVEFSRGTYFHVRPGVGPNGGGAYVNQYTLIMDVMFPDRSESGGWAVLYQTNGTNSNDGDWFVNPDGGVGISGNYGGTVTDGEWHRLALSVDLVAGTYTSYVNGVQVQQLAGQGLDGRFSLYSINDAGNPIEGFYIFADDSGDDAGGFVSSVQFRDVALSSADIEALGGPTADGIPLPEDPRDCSLRNFRVAYDGATNSVSGAWEHLDGDEGFQVFQGDRQIGGDLDAGAATFTDTAPPLGEPAAVYTLKPLVGGEVERECSSNEVQTFVCPTNARCQVDQATPAVTLLWDPEVNVDIQGYRISRDGVPIKTIPGGVSMYTDGSVPGPGVYRYELATLVADDALCPIGCTANVTGVDIGGGVANQYDFNGDLSSSFGGADLIPNISAPLIEGIDDPGFEFLEVDINGEDAQVMSYTRGTIFRMLTGLPPNAGGQYVNQYTLIMDVMFPTGEPGSIEESGWAPLYNTTAENANDGDWFVRWPDGGIGIAGSYGGTIEGDTWHRIALAVDLAAGTYTSFIDGEQVQQNTGEGLDGRFSLYSINDAPLGIDLFADENGENANGFVGSVQIRDRAMTAQEVAAFGGPSAGGIPLFPPCPAGLTCVVDQSARTATLAWKNGLETKGAGYVIRRDGETVGTAALDEESFTDPGLSEGFHLYELAVDGSDCAALSCRVLVVGDHFLLEDFDGYETDAELAEAGWVVRDENSPVENAAWTITNPGGQPNPPTVDGGPTSGRFAISDSDFGGADDRANEIGTGMSHDLWTPSFSTAGSDTVWLHMDVVAQLNNNGNAVFDIDVSTDDGASWDNAFRRIAPGRVDADPFPEFDENVDGFYGRLDVDLSELASNAASVRLRLRHFEPNWDWWIAVDNVLVDDRPSEGGEVELLEEEGFTGGIPNNWTVESGPNSEQVGTWNNVDFCTLWLGSSGGAFPDGFEGRGLHHFDEDFALVDPICSFSVHDEFLITPSIDASGIDRVYLHFRSAILASTSATAEVLISFDGGETYEATPVFSYNAGGLFDSEEDPFYGAYVLEVPRAARRPDVAFAFHYATSGGPSTWWAVDDVRVTGSATSSDRNEFRRGDAADSGSVNITSAIFILNFLFTDVVNELPCTDAGDVNNDGNVNITDPVNLLNHLFGTAPPPAAPGLESCGQDPDEPGSPGDLGCETYTSC